jgi:hypothetical protein
MRERLDIHRADPACAGCHALTDPIGLGLERFDSLGRLREEEHGLPIDPSGELDGVPFEDGAGLAQAVSEHPSLAPCFVQQLVRYALGSTETGAAGLNTLIAAYATPTTTFPDLLRQVAQSQAFLTAPSTPPSSP